MSKKLIKKVFTAIKHNADNAVKTTSSRVVTSTGKELVTPDELMSEYGKLKEFSAKFFEHPVVTDSYKHNQELAKRMGIVIPDKDAAAVVRLPVQIKTAQLADNEIANVALGYFGDPDAIIKMDNNYHPIDELRQGFVHENLHRGWYGKPLRPAKVDRLYYEEVFKPEYSFWDWKVKKLLNPKYYDDGYLSDVLSGEAATNFIDLGRDLGLKLGLKYPGYDAVKKMLDSYKGYKRFMIPRLNTSKAGMRHIWDAMTGKYFAIPAAGILYNNLNEK